MVVANKIAGMRVHAAWVVGFVVWSALLAAGFDQGMRWKFGAGPNAAAPRHQTASDKPRLIIALHSQCPCSIATVQNLSTLSIAERSRMHITLVFTGPDPHHSPVMDKAASLPEAEKVFLDEEAVLKTYGARTSGQALLYSTSGRLLYCGGLTEARGEPGASAGLRAITQTLAGLPCIASAPVYGCALQTAGPNP
jgi:hypothetical protein